MRYDLFTSCKPPLYKPTINLGNHHNIVRFPCRRRHPIGNIVLARHHAVRGHVRADGARAHIHDPGVRRGMQRRHYSGDRAHDTAGSLRNVLR